MLATFFVGNFALSLILLDVLNSIFSNFIQQRILATRDDVDLVAINHCGEIEYMCYKLKYDSTHGRFEGEVK